MNRNRLILIVVVVMAPAFLLLGTGCSSQPSDNAEMTDQAAPAPSSDAGMNGSTAEQAPPPPAAHETAPRSHPQRTHASSQGARSVPEERSSQPSVPQAPPPVVVTIPSGTSLGLNLAEPLSSATAMVGDKVRATLKSPVIVGDRVLFPAGSSVSGQVSDVKSAKKGFKDTGGAMSVLFTRLTAPDGHSASINAGFTKVAQGSAGKKAGIIGGSAVGGALLGRMLGKDAKGAALLGGAVGTAVAGSTKGREATIDPAEDLTVTLERSAETTLKQ